jgi:hypothetical protein
MRHTLPNELCASRIHLSVQLRREEEERPAGFGRSSAGDWHGLLVPVVGVLPFPPELVPDAHAHDVGLVGEHSGHLGEAVEPGVRVEVLVLEEAVAVALAAAPPGLAHVVVQDHHQAALAQAPHHSLGGDGL